MKASTCNIAEIKVSYKPKLMEGPKITSSNTAYEQLKTFYPKDTISLQEHFVILYLNRANNIIGGYHAFTGGITGTIADIRIIMGVALKSMACGIILSHNHPSTNLLPSNADRDITNKIKEVCKLMDIILLDHIILSPEGTFYSFADEGDL
jgi:DNA repair protein RadC